MCSFGLRSTLDGCGQLSGRRGDSLRATLATLSGRTRDYNHTNLHRYNLVVVYTVYNIVCMLVNVQGTAYVYILINLKHL